MEKARQLEIQLSQAISNERILNENLRASENKNEQLTDKLNNLIDNRSDDVANITQEVKYLQSQLNNIIGQEMALRNNVQKLEEENSRLNYDLQNANDRINNYNREISSLIQTNDNLVKEIESTQNMRVRLRNEIIGVIDQNDQATPQDF
jgi:chromosome segregation ATPase